MKTEATEKLTFKTNINCSGCVARVTPALDELTTITKWEVDTLNPNKILTVHADSTLKEEIIKSVSGVGFKIEPI